MSCNCHGEMLGGQWIVYPDHCPVHGANKVCAEDTIHELKVMLDKLINAAYNVGGEHVTELGCLVDTADEAINLLFALGYYESKC